MTSPWRHQAGMKKEMNAEQSRYWKNQSTVEKFILLGYQDHHIFMFSTFLIIYLAILLSNGLIVVVTTWNPALHNPMYFFLRGLSGLEMCYTSATLPKMMANVFSEDLSISSGCTAQMFFILLMGGTECYLLAVMAYDRYLAICRPLHYMRIISHRVQVGLVASSFAINLPMQLLQTGLIFSLSFCGSNEIDHFFCDIPVVLSLACADLYANKVAVYIENALFVILPFLFVLASYGYIARTLLCMPAGTGKQKALSTCSSHLIVVILFYGSGILVYMRPQTPNSLKYDKMLSLLYTVIIPLCNPLIYTLRNREVKASLSRLLSKKKLSEMMIK